MVRKGVKKMKLACVKVIRCCFVPPHSRSVVHRGTPRTPATHRLCTRYASHRLNCERTHSSVIREPLRFNKGSVTHVHFVRSQAALGRAFVLRIEPASQSRPFGLQSLTLSAEGSSRRNGKASAFPTNVRNAAPSKWLICNKNPELTHVQLRAQIPVFHR